MDAKQIRVEDEKRAGVALKICTVAVMTVVQMPLAGRLFPGENFSAQVEREGVYWALTGLLIGYIVLIERRPLSSVNLRWPTWKSFAFGVATAVLMVAGIALLYAAVMPALGSSASSARLNTVKALPVWFRVMLILRAAAFEELFYRGFVIERLSDLTGLRWLAAVISLTAFTVAHLEYWGWAHLMIAGFAGCLLTGLYLWRRDLSCNMIAHLLTDGIGFLSG